MRFGRIQRTLMQAVVIAAGFIAGLVMNRKGYSDTAIGLTAIALQVVPGVPGFLRKLTLGMILSLDFVSDLVSQAVDSVLGVIGGNS